MTDEKNQGIPWKKVVYYEWVDEDLSQFSANSSAFAPYCGQQNGTLGYFITEAEAGEFMGLREEMKNIKGEK